LAVANRTAGSPLPPNRDRGAERPQLIGQGLPDCDRVSVIAAAKAGRAVSPLKRAEEKGRRQVEVGALTHD